MIINGVRNTIVDSAAATVAMGSLTGGLALAAGAMTIAAPVVVGSALGAGAVVASAKIYGFIRDAIFKNRVEELEQHAKSLGINPRNVVVTCTTDQEGDEFSKKHPRLLSRLIEDKELTQWSNESIGLVNDHYRISSKALNEAKEAMSLACKPEIGKTFSGASLALMDAKNRPGFYVKGNHQGVDEENTFVNAFRP